MSSKKISQGIGHSSSLQTLPENREKEKYSQINLKLIIILIPKDDRDRNRNKNSRPTYEHRQKNHKLLGNQVQQCIKIKYVITKLWTMQGSLTFVKIYKCQ